MHEARDAGLRRASRRLLRVPHRWRVVGRVAVVVVLVLIGLRLALPSVLRTAINRRLDRIPAYTGHVDGVDVALWRGGYVLRGLWIAKRTAVSDEPFITARRIDFSLAWRDLIRGKVVSDVLIDEVQVEFVRDKQPQRSRLETDRRWQEVIQDIFPIDITHLEIRKSHVHYIDRTARPTVDLFVDDMNCIATGLQNRPAEVGGGEFPATIDATGVTLGHGRLSLSARAQPLADRPHFDLTLKAEQVSLPSLNRFLRAYGKIDVSEGRFDLYLEMAARDGRYVGYAKPFFTGIKFTDVTEQGKTLLERTWQVFVDGLVQLMKNKPRNQVGTRIPFAGDFGGTNVGFWQTVANLIRHGFVKALPEALEHSITTRSVPPPQKPLTLPRRPPAE